MNIKAIPANHLTPAQLVAWSRIQLDNPCFRSPFFRPEFTQLIASVRDDVEVGLMDEGGEPVGFFPFHRDRRDVARSVGLGVSDYQAVIVDGNARWTAEQLLRGCGLKAWQFDHLLAAQKPFERHHWLLSESPYIDLSNGFTRYRSEVRGSATLKKVHQRARKIEREVGRLHLVAHAFDEDVFRLLLEWKTRQYARIGAVHHLAADWKVEVLRKVANTQGELFGGMLSALYAGDHLIAVHLGMVSSATLHGWFPAYNTAFARYSPGLIFWLRLAEAAEERGFQRIDFGKGDEPYKRVFCSRVTTLAEGAVDFRWLVPAIRRGWLEARERIRRSALRGPVQQLVRGIRKRVAYRNATGSPGGNGGMP